MTSHPNFNHHMRPESGSAAPIGATWSHAWQPEMTLLTPIINLVRTDPVNWLIWMPLVLGLAALSIRDIRSGTLPDSMTLGLLWAGLLTHALMNTSIPLQQAVLGAGVGYGSLWLLGAIFSALARLPWTRVWRLQAVCRHRRLARRADTATGAPVRLNRRVDNGRAAYAPQTRKLESAVTVRALAGARCPGRAQLTWRF